MSMEVDVPSLKFDEPLISARTIKVDVLTSRLLKLHKELQGFEQQQVDLSSLNSVAKDLIQKKILQHNSTTVSAIAACCIADILRLFAPDAPYNNKELTTIFKAFLSQLGDLDKNNENNFRYQFYLLESLSTVKSILVMADLDETELMTVDLFMKFFNSVEKRLPQNVQVYMTDILSQLITEDFTLSSEVVELILEQLASGDNTNAKHIMAVDLCRTSSDALQRRVCQYFTDTLIEVGHSGDDSMEGLERVHDWIQKIYFVAPSLLLNVIPQLEEEMILDELNVRELATKTIGNMFSNKSSIMFHQYPSVWKAWLGRSRDKSVSIRCQWVETACLIFQHHPDLVAKEMNECLMNLLQDMEEKVRLAACKSMGKMEIDIIINYVTDSLLETLAMRSKDKKNIIQKAAMNAIGKIYNEIYPQMNEQHISKKFAWIPGALFNCIFVDNLRIIVALDDTVQRYIFPENLDDTARTERLITVYMSFDEKSKSAFHAFINYGKRNIEMMKKFVEYCENDGMESMISEYEQGKMDHLMKLIADQFEDHARVTSCLRQLHEIDDNNIIRALRTSIDVGKEYKDILKAQNSLLEKLEQQAHGALEPCKWILNRTHLLALNKSNVPFLYSALRSTRGKRQSVIQDRSNAAQDLVKKIGEVFPRMCLPYVDDLVRHIMNDNGGPIADESLEVMASIAKEIPSELILSNQTLERLSSYANNGNMLQAKHATMILCNSNDTSTICAELVEDLISYTSLENPNLVTTLTSLSVFALYTPLLVQPHLDILFDFITQKCLAQTLLVQNPDNNYEWEEYDDLKDISKQKLAGVPILSNYLIGMGNLKEQVDDDIVTNLFTILWNFIETTCDVAVTNRTSAAESSHLRLLAAETIVQLAEYPPYQQLVTMTHFERLALLLQDSCFFVRSQFGESLMLGLIKSQLHSRYYTLLFLCAHEPEESFLKKVAHFIRGRASRVEPMKSTTELTIIRLIHLLAHHPDFGQSDEELYTFSQYIDFYISCIVTSENISYLYNCVQKIKISVDTLAEDEGENSNILCDLACRLFERKSKRSGWQIGPVQKTALQSKLYRLLPPGPIQKAAIERNYLSDALTTRINNEQPQKALEKRSRLDSAKQTTSKRHRMI
ncbi:armadillo-type protein [Halteromyces radiatus]|uniref:armadillo-type protein n=1 Tax=Halteromyces radiatus TaxID=101107 RepID=UPI0022203441|nr:armadillo-type protein [Halteromyces radiatus]KAI8082933.1 armadillo-type protein [Halteromyces radiatus]